MLFVITCVARGGGGLLGHLKLAMRVLRLFLIFFSLCFAAEKPSAFPLKAKSALQELETLCTKNFCNDKVKFHDSQDTSMLTFSIYLIKEWCSDNIIMMTYLLDLQLSKFCQFFVKKFPPGGHLTCLKSLNYAPQKAQIEHLRRRHIFYTSIVEKLKKGERLIGDKLQRLLKSCIDELEASLSKLPSPTETDNLSGYITTSLNFAKIHTDFFFTPMGGSSLAFLKDMMQEDKLYHQLFYQQVPFNRLFDGFAPETSGLSAFFYLRRKSLFPDRPEIVYNLITQARHALYLRSASGPVATLDLRVSQYADEMELAHQSVHELFAAIKNRKDYLLNQFQSNPGESWPGRLIIRGLALLVDHQLMSVDILAVSAAAIVDSAKLVLACLPNTDSSNLETLRLVKAHVVDSNYEPDFIQISKEASDLFEAYLLKSKFITKKNILMVEAVMDILAFAIAACHKMEHSGAVKFELFSKSDRMNIFKNLTQHLILRNQQQGRFKGMKIAQLDDHITGYLNEERKRLGLPLPEDKNIAQLEESIASACSPSPQPTPVESPLKKGKATKKKKAQKAQKQVPVPEDHWDDDEVDEGVEAVEELAPQMAEDTPADQLSSSTDDTLESSDGPGNPSFQPPTTPIAFQYELLIDDEDVELLDTVTAKDLSYAYLLIGNRIYKKLLRPFLVELQRHNIFLFSAFRKSMKAFSTEVRMHLLRNRLLVEAALAVSGIESMANFKQCIRFYERRLAVAHPHIINDVFDRKSILIESLQSLGGVIHSRYGLGKELIESNKQSFGELEINYAEPIQCNKTFELSVLFLSEYLKTESLAAACGGVAKLSIRNLRGMIAHLEPTNDELLLCINLFKDNPAAYHFLTNIQNNLT